MSSDSSVSVTRSDTGITRKLKDICRELTLPAKQGKVLEFLTNTENAQKINGLVEDICEALMKYWVCMSNCLLYTVSDLYVRLHCKKISTKRTADSL